MFCYEINKLLVEAKNELIRHAFW